MTHHIMPIKFIIMNAIKMFFTCEKRKSVSIAYVEHNANDSCSLCPHDIRKAKRNSGLIDNIRVINALIPVCFYKTGM